MVVNRTYSFGAQNKSQNANNEARHRVKRQPFIFTLVKKRKIQNFNIVRILPHYSTYITDRCAESHKDNNLSHSIRLKACKRKISRDTKAFYSTPSRYGRWMLKSDVKQMYIVNI